MFFLISVVAAGNKRYMQANILFSRRKVVNLHIIYIQYYISKSTDGSIIAG